jgi:iron(III) transport system ATP-binding protein
MAKSVHIQNLCKTFAGNTKAMDNISLEIAAGELFFLLGPSGCGKTTLLRAIAGFCLPDSGSIRIGDQDITRLPPHRRDTGMVFQSYALWPHMTVWQNVAFGLDMRKIPDDEKKKRTGDALEIVQMSARANGKPNELSGGQQQRVALARALVVHPQCLLLDEPLSNLDAKLRLEMRQEIRNICKQAGTTAVYVTHDQKEALSVADRLAVLDRGQIQQIGTPSGIYRRPTSAFVAGFIGETNFLDGRITAIADGSVSVETPIGPLSSSLPPPDGFRIGMSVSVSIRPEAVTLGRPPADMTNLLTGTIRHTVYLGEVAQHEIGIRDIARLKASELNPRIAGPCSGDIPLWIHPDDVVLLPPDKS